LSDNSVGVFGWAWEPGENTGVMGYSGPADTGLPPASPAKTGVFGYAAQDATSVGVLGASTAGEGVRGTSSGSNGVAGTSASGIASGVYGENTAGGYGTYGRSNSGAGSGVFGESTSGTGVAGATTSGVGGRFSAGAAGTAFQALGRVSFSTSGLVTVAVGTKTKTVMPGSDLVSSTRILCTLESNQSGLLIERITKDTTANTFKVYVSALVASGNYARVAWFIIG
jgi:hypothetical protein